MMQRFVDRLSPASRRHRFFSETAPPADTIASLCDSSNQSKQLTIMVTRTIAGQPRIIAVGSYWARTADEAEVAMAVDDDFHGKGLGTILLERLAMLAIHRGFTRLWAVTHTDNLAMREVFRESGYPVHETYEGGDMQVELSLHQTESTTTRLELRERIATTASLRPFFNPRSVAVIGASRDPKTDRLPDRRSPRRQPISRPHLSGEPQSGNHCGPDRLPVRRRDPRCRRSGGDCRAT